MKWCNDGWHKICGCKIWVKNQMVKRGVSGSGFNQKPVYPYRRCKDGGWDNCAGSISVDAFRAGMKRDTIRMM